MSDPRDAERLLVERPHQHGLHRHPERSRRWSRRRGRSPRSTSRKFDAIVVAGGQAPMFTFERRHELHKKFVEFYEAGKIAAALCHGVAILRYATPRAAASTSRRARR